MRSFIVYGNYGDLIVNASTGAVLQYEPDSETGAEYDHVLQFDIDEYTTTYPGEQLDHVDICDIGFWTKDGKYEPPESDFRTSVAQDRAPA